MDVTPHLALRTAPRVVLDQVAARGDQVRFRVRKPDGSWSAVTWADFARQLRAVAALLVERGVQPGERLAVYGANSVTWAAAALGIQAAGAVMVPIYPASTAAQAAYVLDHAECKAAFVTGSTVGRAVEATASFAQPPLLLGLDDLVDADATADARTQVTTWSDAIVHGAALDAARPAAVDDRLASIDLDRPGLMLYTSGTSGNPKGVPLTHRNVGVNGADWLQSNAPLLDEEARDLLWLPMSHIFGWGELCMGNILGWESWLATPAEALALLPEVAPQVFMSVPAYWEKLARTMLAAPGCAAGDPDTDAARRRTLAALTGGRLRFCLSGGAGLKVEIKQALHDAGLLVIEGYGLTETSPTLTLNRPDAYRFDTVGRPFPSVEVRLADDGEILARGPSVFAGYHRDPEATAAAFTDDGWFATGDVGRWTDDGFLQIIDRKKDILVTAGGKNVPPVNLEVRFVDDPAIERVVVYGDGKPYLVAAVWLAPDIAAADRERVAAARIDAVNASLARYETIKKFFVADEPLSVEAGTLTTSLKLRRKAVYTRYRERFEALYG
ncbi:MAG TPA: AMP-dependent synthetase/ligase [Kofleriaceae bacterium]|nr:AMP-dependent synthetase/ligase [Kofleriaceae bacterium]